MSTNQAIAIGRAVLRQQCADGYGNVVVNAEALETILRALTTRLTAERNARSAAAKLGRYDAQAAKETT